jgi:tripartite-type tricarboxylate transporter receptor subunit TctC
MTQEERTMKQMKKLWLGVAALAALIGAASAPASAQNWPTQRVTIVVPFGAGSVTDILARLFADEMSKRWGQQVIVENKGGLAGTASVAKAAPDGYTLMVTSNGHTVAGLVTKDPPFDPVKDFSGITRLGSAPLFLISNPGLAVTNLKEAIDAAKAQPGKLNFSSPGLASTTFIAGAMFRKQTGIDIKHIPFKGAPESVQAVLRNDVQMYFAPVNLTKELAEAGKVRAIATVTPQRLPEMPDVPTFRESGFDFTYDSWFGLMTQSGVPRDIVKKINQDVVASLQSPEVKDKLAKQFVIGVIDTPEAFDKIISDDVARLTEVFKEVTN